MDFPNFVFFGSSSSVTLKKAERTMLPELPPELMADILSRLPVKTLLQIRCVSKPWRRFIDSWYFIETHLNRSIKTRDNQFLILSHSRSDVINSVDLDFVEREVDLPNPLVCSREIPRFHRRGGVIRPRFRSLPDDLQIIVPLWQRQKWLHQAKVQVWGTCNGLVLISGFFSTCLWNPSTRKQCVLPRLRVWSWFKLYGFGYDSACDDYKVIKILNFIDNHHHQVWVYSLQSNSWREIVNCLPPSIQFGIQPGVLVHGALHWPVKVKPVLDDGQQDVIFAFDLRTEECRMFPQPKCRNAEFHSRLGACKGLLCLIYSYLPLGFEIWVMREPGVEESWTRVTLQHGDFISYPGGFINATLRDGKVALLHNSGIFFNKDSFEIFRTSPRKSDVCIASLISPGGGGALYEGKNL